MHKRMDYLMKLQRLHDYIYYYNDVISHEVCDSVIEKMESTLSFRNKDFKTLRKNAKNNDVLPLTSEVQRIIDPYFVKVHENYLEDNKLLKYFCDVRKYNHRFRPHYVYRFYKPGDSYDWHVDFPPDFEQLFSYVLYLNDDFEGGNTLFMNQRLKVVPRKGSIICYLSDLQNIHKGAIIKSGFKRIILGGIGRH